MDEYIVFIYIKDYDFYFQSKGFIINKKEKKIRIDGPDNGCNKSLKNYDVNTISEILIYEYYKIPIIINTIIITAIIGACPPVRKPVAGLAEDRF